MSLRIDDLQINDLKIIQDDELFCFGTDSVLLANFAQPKANAKILDIGTGNGIIPILLSAKVSAKEIIGLEIQEKSYNLAKENFKLNKIDTFVSAKLGDIKDETIFPLKNFDYITCNPPYTKIGTGIKNQSSPLALARHEILCNLEDIIKASSRLLNSKGKLAVVHKPERCAEIIYTMKRYNIEPKRLLTVYPKLYDKACLVLVEGVKDGGVEMNIMPPLYIYDENGNYTANIADLYKKSIKKEI